MTWRVLICTRVLVDEPTGSQLTDMVYLEKDPYVLDVLGLNDHCLERDR